MSEFRETFTEFKERWDRLHGVEHWTTVHPESGPMRVCPECGAVIQGDRQKDHADWHRRSSGHF